MSETRNEWPGRGGIALLNRLDRSLDEAFEQLFDVLVEAAILVRNRGLRGQRERQPHSARGKRADFASHNIQARSGAPQDGVCN